MMEEGAMTLTDRRGLLLGAGAAALALPGFGSAQSRPSFAALNASLRAHVDAGKLAGIVTMLSHRGRVVNTDAYGRRDLSQPDPIKADTIFRIASMTKPIAGVAMMQLYEQGKWRLDDPVAKHIPEFAGLKVKTASGGLEDQKAPMTMAQIMSHTAGFGVSATYAQAGLQAGDLTDMIAKLSKLPLERQPGTDWAYGPVVNIQGYLVEKLSGKSLDAYLHDHIFGPLRMADTGFWVAPAKAARAAPIHTFDTSGKLIVAPASRVQTTKPKFLSGSGGLSSTAPDYHRFCHALLRGGELDGARILRPETVRHMRKSVLAPGVGVDLYGPTQPGVGFGMDFAVNEKPEISGLPYGRDTYWWGGAFGTWFWIDPTHEVIFVGMIQNLNGSTPWGGTPDVRGASARDVYAALGLT
jgi:CubicO group peptidase (beta-lactamase class C family)